LFSVSFEEFLSSIFLANMKYIAYIYFMCHLKLESITKSFDKNKPVLNSVSFSVTTGEMLVILGASGCGKTTLLRIIAGLEKPDEGRVYLAGREVTHIEPRDRDVAMVFQNYALYPHMTVFENLAFALKVRKVARSLQNQKVEETAVLLGLAEYLNRKPGQLSGGQRQRVALGRAIIRDPALFLFDEPLSNIDAKLRIKMRSDLLSLHRKIGGTSVYVTHDQMEAMSLADKIIILNQGEQIGPATPRDLYDEPPDIFVAGFLGNPGMNLIECSTDDSGGRFMISDLASFPSRQWLPSNKRLIVGFRPEHCEISSQAGLPVEVINCEDTGKEYLINLKVSASTKIFALSGRRYPCGEKFFLNIKKACFFDAATGKILSAE
jgi:sn-glycerol 3-phosphate transport system ATP-binding protein